MKKRRISELISFYYYCNTVLNCSSIAVFSWITLPRSKRTSKNNCQLLPSCLLYRKEHVLVQNSRSHFLWTAYSYFDSFMQSFTIQIEYSFYLQDLASRTTCTFYLLLLSLNFISFYGLFAFIYWRVGCKLWSLLLQKVAVFPTSFYFLRSIISVAACSYILVVHTVRNLHFLSKNSTLISRENCRFFWLKNSWKCCGFGLFSCWQLWFHEKNCLKFFLWKTRENVGILSTWNFWTKIWLFE